MDKKIAVLLTCFNRRDTTLACLKRLYDQFVPSDINLHVFLVDDGCSDGTGAAVRKAYPDIQLIQGDGTLFWCNGMRLAWEHAAKEDPDFYLWLNDDSMMLDGAIETLLSTWECEVRKSGLLDTIVIGSCRDPKTGKHSYGGKRRIGKHPGKLTPVLPQEFPVGCDTFEGNLILIPKAAYLKLGIMRSFKHAMGDIDYGYRAKNCGCQLLIGPGYLAECEMNVGESLELSKSLKRAERLSILMKRVPPKDWWFFLRSHAGWRALIYFPRIYLRCFFNMKTSQIRF